MAVVQPAPYLFLSYASVERQQALRIADLLEQQGIRVWLDRRSIAGGTSWSAEIVDGIEGCAALLLLSSPSAMASPNVQQEVQLAWEGRRPILPLLLVAAPAPSVLRYALTGRQWVEVLDRPESAWLPDALRALAGLGLPATGDAATAPAAPTTAAAPAVPTVAAAPPVHHNLPAALTSFIGRQEELAEVTALLAQARLVTLVGVGGTGKTRLALELGRRLLDQYPDGVWLVELAPLADPTLVVQAVAQAVGVREQPGVDVLATLLDALNSRNLLLLLDNCEHLLEPAARLTDALLRGCPQLRVLATSREALGTSGERSWPVPSLPLPAEGAATALETLGQNPAVQLFAERAQAANARFAITPQNAATVIQVCRRLDGIPLALELAAARLRAMSVEQLAARLDQRFRLLTGGSRAALPRQQTLQALVDWSYQLLSAPEQRLFDRLSVFAGGFSLEAAEAICSGEAVASAEVFELLVRLVEKSLAVAEQQEDGTERYRLLETLRQFGREKLVAAGEAEAIHERHAAYFLQLAERTLEQIRATAALPSGLATRVAALALLEQEDENLRAALGWLIEQRQVEAALRLATVLSWYWASRAKLSERNAAAAELLSLARAAGQPELYGRVLRFAAYGLHRSGDAAGAQRYIDTLHAEAELPSDPLQRANLLSDEGLAAQELGQLERAQALLEQSLVRYQALGDQNGIAMQIDRLGAVAHLRGDYALARRLLEEGLALCRTLGNAFLLAWALHNLSCLTLDEGDAAAARPLLDEALRLRRQVGNQLNVGSLAAFAALAAVEEQPEPALRLATAVTTQCARLEIPLQVLEQRMLRRAQAVEPSLDAATVARAREEGAVMTLEQAVAEALGDDATRR